MATTVPESRVVSIDPDHGIARLHSVVIARFRREPVARELLTLRNTWLDTIRLHVRASVLYVVDPRIPVMTVRDDIRAYLTKLLSDTDGQSLGNAVVFGTSGFGSAALRSAFGALRLISRARTPTKAFATVPEGVAYVAGLNGLSAPVLQNAYDDLCRAMEPPT